jgi:hypothetical protein
LGNGIKTLSKAKDFSLTSLIFDSVLEIGKKELWMEMGLSFMTGGFIQENGKKTKLMEKESNAGPKEIGMKEAGMKVNNMALVLIIGKVVLSTLVIGKWERRMEKEFMLGIMDQPMMASG